MTDFVTDAQALDMARRALALWGGTEAPVLIKNRENIVFDARLADGGRVALRLHRPGYQGRRDIEAELGWCDRLAAEGFPVPRPIRLPDGALVGAVDGRLVSAVAWLDGVPIGAGDRPLPADEQAVRSLAQDLGALIARLHVLTDAGAAPDANDRQRWDIDGLLGEDPNWNRFWDNPTLSPEERDILLRARARARDRMAEATDIGPIHADLLRENVMKTGQGLALIDFDDSGVGFRLYDLGTAIVQSVGDPMLPQWVDGIVAGYRSVRALPDAQVALLPVFVALRGFASAGWMITRADSTHPNMRLYAERAVTLGQHVLDDTAPWA